MWSGKVTYIKELDHAPGKPVASVTLCRRVRHSTTMMTKLGALLVGVVALIANEDSQVWARPQVGPEGVQVRRDGVLVAPLDIIDSINEVNGPLNPSVSTFNGNDDVQLTSGFDPLAQFPGAEAEFGIAASPDANFGNRPILAVESSIPDDVNLKVPGVASLDFGHSLDHTGISSFPSVKLDSVDDVQLTLSDPTLVGIDPGPSGKTSGKQLPPFFPGDVSGGNFQPGVGTNFNTGFGQESNLGPPSFPQTSQDVQSTGVNFGASDVNQFGPGVPTDFGPGTQFQGNVPPPFDGSDFNQFAGTGSADFSNSAPDAFNVPNVNVPDVQPVNPHRTLGDGGKKLPNPNDLLALLAPGLAVQQQAAQRNPLEKIFNLLTLGVFDGRQSGSNPLKDLLNPIISGIFGNSGQRGLGLGAIGLGDEALGELAQVASAGLDDFAREATTGVQLAQDEVRFQAGEKLRQIVSNLQQTGRTFSVVGQNTYRSLLQKQDALAKMLMGVVTNIGSYVNTSVGNTFEKIGSTANTFGRFFNDLKVGLLNSLISKGEASRELFSGTLDTVGTAFKDFTSAAQAAAEDNIKAITGLKSNRKFR